MESSKVTATDTNMFYVGIRITVIASTDVMLMFLV